MTVLAGMVGKKPRRGPSPEGHRHLRQVNACRRWAGFSWCAANPGGVALASARFTEPHEGDGAREGVRHHGRMKASKGQPHGRDRDETSPAGRGGSKASRGCETLRAQRNQRRWVCVGGMWLPAIGKTSKGRRTSEGARRVPEIPSGVEGQGRAVAQG
jgi:hypothetical protein